MKDVKTFSNEELVDIIRSAPPILSNEDLVFFERINRELVIRGISCPNIASTRYGRA